MTFSDKATTKILHQATLTNEEPIYIKQSKIPKVHCDAIELHVASWLQHRLIQPAGCKFNSSRYAITNP